MSREKSMSLDEIVDQSNGDMNTERLVEEDDGGHTNRFDNILNN